MTEYYILYSYLKMKAKLFTETRKILFLLVISEIFLYFKVNYRRKEERLRAFIPDFQYLFYDFSLSGKTQIQGIEKLQAMIYLFKYIYSPDLEVKLNMIFRLLRNLPDSEMDYIIAISLYLLYATQIPPDTLRQIAQENISQKGGEAIMTTAEQLIAQGEIRGEIKGKIEAIESILEFRFGARGLHLMKEFRKIKNLETLQKILSLAKTSLDLESFEKEMKSNVL